MKNSELTSIKGSTGIIGIIGYPIKHSISPIMQNAAVKHLKLDLIYIPIRLRPEGLGGFVESIRGSNIIGLNVTIPHKEAVVTCLESLSPEAKAAGAVNLMVQKDGRLFGHNTDGVGFLRSLSEKGFNPHKKKALIIGAGGAARGVIFSLAKAGLKAIVVSNRTISRGERLIQDMGNIFEDMEFTLIPFKVFKLTEFLHGIDLLINTTSIGMGGGGFEDYSFLDVLGPGTLVADIVYHPRETELLREAKKRGLNTLDGTGMLVHQGAECFRVWTGLKPPIDIMKKAVLEALD